MKRMTALILCVLLLAGCGGNIRHVMPAIGPSELFTDDEIEAAMDVVLAYFQKEFEGCTLTELQYDEAAVRDEMVAWAIEYGENQAIVLISSFDVDHTGGNGSLNPGETYRNWKWILTRSGGEGWELRTWGYG